MPWVRLPAFLILLIFFYSVGAEHKSELSRSRETARCVFNSRINHFLNFNSRINHFLNFLNTNSRINHFLNFQICGYHRSHVAEAYGALIERRVPDISKVETCTLKMRFAQVSSLKLRALE